MLYLFIDKCNKCETLVTLATIFVLGNRNVVHEAKFFKVFL